VLSCGTLSSLFRAFDKLKACAEPAEVPNGTVSLPVVVSLSIHEYQATVIRIGVSVTKY
jgi:hypothetical protein